MSPVSPVFHTEVIVTIGLKNQSREELSLVNLSLALPTLRGTQLIKP